jgi:hypothetical protein
MHYSNFTNDNRSVHLGAPYVYSNYEVKPTIPDSDEEYPIYGIYSIDNGKISIEPKKDGSDPVRATPISITGMNCTVYGTNDYLFESPVDGYITVLLSHEFVTSRSVDSNTLTYTNGRLIEARSENPSPKFGTDEGADNQYSTFSYTLRENEYFLYTDSKKQEFNILETGTTISAKVKNSSITDISDSVPNPITWYVPTGTTTEKLSKDGAKAVKEESWKTVICDTTTDLNGNITLNSGTLLTITENRILMLGGGTEIKVQLRPDIDGGSARNPYYGYISFRRDGRYTCDSLPTDMDTESEKLIKQSNILSKYNIQYREEGSDNWSSLPRAVNSELDWNGYSILNIMSSKTNPQILRYNPFGTAYLPHKQRFKLTDKDNTESTVPSVYSGNTLYPQIPPKDTYLQSNRSVEFTGGSRVDTSGLDSDGKVIYLSFMSYTKLPMNGDNISENTMYVDENYWEVTEDSNMYTFKCNPTDEDDPDKNILLQSLKANTDTSINGYILPIEFIDTTSLSKNAKIKLEVGTYNSDNSFTALKPTIKPLAFSSDLTDINSGIYYYDIPYELNNGDNRCLKISTENFQKGDSFIVHNIVPYTPDSESHLAKNGVTITVGDATSYEIDRVYSDVNALNMSNLFDYTYQPDESSLIENPLDSGELFNKNHFFNSYTIPQIAKIDIKIENKRM